MKPKIWDGVRSASANFARDSGKERGEGFPNP